MNQKTAKLAADFLIAASTLLDDGDACMLEVLGALELVKVSLYHHAMQEVENRCKTQEKKS